ncbi:hypothetical protein Scep_011088 [Stephania cephalantha]|uniref:Glycoside hydrolase family 28 n=1 Tax=Stephania cephalantha TaxID=152367 RepID=A0AAP0JYS0_9MAGN
MVAEAEEAKAKARRRSREVRGATPARESREGKRRRGKKRAATTERHRRGGSTRTFLAFNRVVNATVVVQYNVNVMDLGAKPDGQTDSTKSFMDAWAAACACSASSAVIYVPPGTYGVKGVTIAGGTLDAGGAAVWACKLKASSPTDNNCIQGATSLSFTNSKDVVINGLRSVNSQMFHIVINGCKNVNVRGVMIAAPGDSPNTDGIHVQMSTGVSITKSGIKTGDDCISIGPGTNNLWMESIACGPGHGISIGSLAKGLKEPGVENVTVKTAVFTGTQNGLRIKAWGRPSNGYVKGVLFQHATMNNVENPILIDQNYCPRDDHCPNQVSGIKISDVKYKDIHGTSATQVAVKFDCSHKNPCTAITLENVKLTYDQDDQPAQSSCVNANGSALGVVDPKSCLWNQPSGWLNVSSKVLHSITTSMPVVSSLPSPSKGGNPSSSAKKVKIFLLLYFAKAVHLEEETL